MEASKGALVKGLHAIKEAVAGTSSDRDEDGGKAESFGDLEKRLNAEINAKVHDATEVRLSGVTPLMVAALEGSLDIVALLLDHAADPNAVDDQGRTPLGMAEAKGHGAVAQALRARGASAEATIPADQALMLAAERGDAAGIEAAVARGAQVNSHDTRKSADGKTPLVLAVENGHEDAVKALLRLGADVELKAKTSPHNTRAILDSESQERTPLHVAAALGRTGLAKLLLDSGASLKARDESRETPLHVAAAGNHVEAVRLLLEHGADVEAKGRDNMTPLLYAAARGHVEAGLALLDGGADARAANRSRETALHYAVSSRSAPLVRALVARGADPKAPNKYGSSALERGAHIDEIAAILAAAPEHGGEAPARPAKGKARAKAPKKTRG
jgi:cytohesin